MRYHERQRAREAARSPQAAAVASFLNRGSAARAVVAKTMSDLGQIPACDGITWPKDASGGAQVLWHDNEFGDEGWRRVKAGSADFRLDPSSCIVVGEGYRRRTNFKHRLFVECPDCRSWVQTGRFHQHAGSAKCLAVRR